MNRKSVVFLILFCLSFFVSLFVFKDKINVPYFNGLNKKICYDIFYNDENALVFKPNPNFTVTKIDKNHYYFEQNDFSRKTFLNFSSDEIKNIKKLTIYNGFEPIFVKDLKTNYNYDTIKISKEDAKFFADLIENKQFALQQNGETQNLIKFADEIGPTYKTQQTSQILSDLIAKAYNEQKAIRIDFDNNVTVVLKVDTKGKVSAEFIPGDKAVEMYLRNNIGFLKQRFDDQNIPYNDILYKHSNNGNRQKNRQNQQNKGD